MFFKELIQLNFTSQPHTCLTAWSEYKDNSDKSNEPPRNPSGVCGASVGDTCLLRDDEGTIPEVDAYASIGIKTICAYDDWVLSLRTYACYATLQYLNLSCLAVIMHISKPHKHYIDETQWSLQTDRIKTCISEFWNQNVKKFQRCLSIIFCNSDER